MSRMALAPVTEVAVHALQVREYRSLLARNHLPKHASAQAPRPRLNQLATKTLTPSNRGTVALSMPASVPKTERVQAILSATAPSRLGKPVERVAGRIRSEGKSFAT
jgi:hypothetical protein